jgi:hypothetical protein
MVSPNAAVASGQSKRTENRGVSGHSKSTENHGASGQSKNTRNRREKAITRSAIYGRGVWSVQTRQWRLVNPSAPKTVRCLVIPRAPKIMGRLVNPRTPKILGKRQSQEVRRKLTSKSRNMRSACFEFLLNSTISFHCVLILICA